MQVGWLRQRGFRTYQIAAILDEISAEPVAYARQLEALTLDGGLRSFLEPWPAETLLHQFARYVADWLFEEDTDARSLIRIMVPGSWTEISKWIMPVDEALCRYGLATMEEAFAVPYSTPEGSLSHQFDADACYDYFTDGLMQSQKYDDLLGCMADEVFHILFHNRRVLAGLNEWIAGEVRSVDVDVVSGWPEPDPEMTGLFEKSGALKRKAPPEWVKDAVYFRDQGRCANCKADLTGLVGIVSDDQYDHVIPLARGGLNDVTNIQLLCQRCNLDKSDNLVPPSDLYRRVIP